MTVIDTVRTETISANIQGENAGQIAVGNYNLQIGSVHGGQVNVILPGQGPRLQPRKPPVFLRPRPVRGMLDREAEVNVANAGLQEAVPLEFYAQSGMGKTTLLRHLAHHAPDSSFPDGVLYLSARRQPLADILQSLVDAFYKSDDRLKFTDAQLRHALQSRRALILLDDVDLAADEMTEMLDVASGCTFVFASPQRQLWGEGRTVALRGLPLKDALKLMERELGRRLKPEERPAAAALCEALKGHPLHILQVTASAREDGLSLAEMAAHLPAVPSSETVTGQVLASLSASERQVLAALAAVDGAPLSVEHLNAMTELPDAAPIVESLLQRGLIQAHSPRYSLTGSLNQVLARVWDLTPWADRALSHFTAWAERQRPTPDRLLEVADAILQTLRWAAGAGRWLEVLRLGRAVEGDLALSGRWGAWAEVLRIAYQAAQGLGDRAAEAWALHQLGTRALCLEDTLIARSSLIQALRLREAMGDQAGAALTRHNLNILLGPPPPPQSPTQSSPPAAPVAGGSFFVDTIIAFFTVLAIVLSGLVFWQYWPYRTPTIVALAPTPTHTAAATPSTILSPTASPTVTAPATETFTPTSMPTATQEPTHTPTSTPTFTPSPSPTLTPSPTFTLSPSPTLTPSPTPTFIPSPSPTLTRIPTDTPQPEPVIKFWADRYEIRSGECTTTHWDADYVQEVYYQGQGVVGHGERWECPGQTAAYTLTVVRRDGSQEIHTVTVKVIAVTVPPSPPDLVVTALQATGGPSMISDRIELPIRVVVKNQGDTPADTFKVSMEYNGPNGTFVIPFTAKGQSSIWYPSTSAPLGPGIEAFFEGVVTFRLDLAGEAVSLRAIADSCSGDEFMPSYCRVEESNESNNGSNWIKVALPTPTPTPTPTPRIVL